MGGAVGGAKRAIGDRIPRFMRWGFIKGFVTWTHVLEVKRYVLVLWGVVEG